MSAPGNSPRAVPAHDRTHEEVVDLETGAHITVADYIRDDSYGTIIADKRVKLENELVEGRVRFVCPWCEQAMTLRSIPTQDKTEQRFFFKHRVDDGTCTGSKGKSAAQICALKFAHAKEGARHKQIKRWVEESLAADPRFSNTELEARWKSIDGVRWRQPDVQTTWQGQRIALEVQLATTFLHVIAERMTFYRGEGGRLLWLFGDLDPAAFRLAEDDLFYSNNRNAFRVSAETVALSKAHGRFALECAWHSPRLADGEVVDILERQVVFFDQLTFDVGSSGAPRAFYFDYDRASVEVEQARQTWWRERQDAPLREAVEAYVLAYDYSDEADAAWAPLRQRLRARGFDLPARFYGNKGPFYHLQAAYSAKVGRPVMNRQDNLLALANTLHQRHVGTLWVFLVLVAHFERGSDFNRPNVYKWRGKLKTYWDACLARDASVRPDRTYDDLLAFLFPGAAGMLRASPADPDVQEQVKAGLGAMGAPWR